MKLQTKWLGKHGALIVSPELSSEILFFDHPLEDMIFYRVIKGKHSDGSPYYIWYQCERDRPGSYAIIHAVII